LTAIHCATATQFATNYLAYRPPLAWYGSS
jgi:hypothetical protein